MIHNYGWLSLDGTTIERVEVVDDQAEAFMVTDEGEQVPVPDELPKFHKGIFTPRDHTATWFTVYENGRPTRRQGVHLCCGNEGPWIGWTTKKKRREPKGKGWGPDLPPVEPLTAADFDPPPDPTSGAE